MKKKKFTFKMTRRQLLKAGMIGGAGLMLPLKFKVPKAFAFPPGNLLVPDANNPPKYQAPLVKPPAMPGQFTPKKTRYDELWRSCEYQIFAVLPLLVFQNSAA